MISALVLLKCCWSGFAVIIRGSDKKKLSSLEYEAIIFFLALLVFLYLIFMFAWGLGCGSLLSSSERLTGLAEKIYKQW